MFNWFIKPQKELEKAIHDSDVELKRVKNELEIANGRLNNIKKTSSSLPFHFDFKKMNAFSIERNFNNHEPCTIIGYVIKETHVSNNDGVITTTYKDVIKEWYLYCDENEHKKLAEEFAKILK